LDELWIYITVDFVSLMSWNETTPGSHLPSRQWHEVAPNQLTTAPLLLLLLEVLLPLAHQATEA
jgi:hypothetical protein